MISNKYIYSLPLLNLHGNLPVRSVYAVARSFQLITVYAISLVLVVGVGDSGKLFALSSAYRTSSNDLPGCFLSFSSLKCFNIVSIFLSFF